MDYLLYEAEDFAADDSYLSYYFRTNPKDVLFWEDWIRHHPERLDVITQADQLISLLSVALPEQELQEEFARIDRGLQGSQGLQGDGNASTVPVRRLPMRTWLLAAAVILLVAAGIFLLRPAHSSLPVAGNLLKRVNDSNTPMALTLEDGSVVRLDPGGKIMYPAHFAADRREVYLEGGAFFDVSKSPQRPFYVYDDNVVAHVLGTSFTIRRNIHTAQVEVAVLTGKVEVYQKPGRETSGDRVILTPNQRAVYQEKEERLEATLVDRPQAVKPDSTTDVFNTTTLGTILERFEQTYAIDIEVENEAIYDCHFSGDLSHMGLYEQLDVICQSINLTYEVIGTRILIRGKGCN